MKRFIPLILAAATLAAAPLSSPDLPTRILEYVTPEPEEVTMVAVGDMMLSRAVATRMRRHGYDYPFASTSEYIRMADIAFGNLETPITPGPEVLPFEMSFRADPEVALALKDAGFDILSLANNHTPNFGEPGLEDTFKYLDDADIAHVGAGIDAKEAGQAKFMSVKGVVFAFLAYTDPSIVPRDYEAGESRAGTAFMHIDQMKEAVANAAQFADIVIVSMHAGDEYEPLPNERQKDFARAAIDAGAEMVIGHHPHVVQTMEVYQGKYILYSLGNFIFDQMWSQDTREGMVAHMIFTKNGLSGITFHPVRIEDYAQPRFLEVQGNVERVMRRLHAAP
ncbi:MAG: CapA family protein [Minisyncoccia bacterium]